MNAIIAYTKYMDVKLSALCYTHNLSGIHNIKISKAIYKLNNLIKSD